MTEKETDYQSICKSLLGLIEGEKDALANLSNSSALLFHSLDRLNWAGFYLFKEGELVLGPFQGKPACIRIGLGKGVCGTAALERKTIVVEDVHQFPGHIACDGASESEIVIPIIKNNRLMGVLDVDSPVKARFGENDRIGMERFSEILAESICWEDLLGQSACKNEGER